jgi:hypothetical protein
MAREGVTMTFEDIGRVYKQIVFWMWQQKETSQSALNMAQEEKILALNLQLMKVDKQTAEDTASTLRALWERERGL